MPNLKIFDAIFSKERVLDSSFLAALSLYGLYLIRGIFNSGYFSNFDLSQHFTESVYVARVLLPQYHQLIGWNPYLYLGWPQGQFNPVGSYIAFCILYYLLSWALSPLTIFKLTIAGFFLLQGWSVYYAAKWFGLTQLSGFVGGFLVLGTAGGFEVGGPLAIMYYGMYDFAFSVALIPLILAIYHQSFVRDSVRLLLVTAVLSAFDLLLHSIGGVFLMMALLVYTLAQLLRSGIFEDNRKENILKILAKFGLIILIVLGICSFWLLPAYENQSVYNTQPNLIRELGVYSATYNQLRVGTIFGEKTIPLVTNLLHPTQSYIIDLTFSPTQHIVNSGPFTFYQLLIVLSIIGSTVVLMRPKSFFPVLVLLSLIGLFMYLSLGPSYYEFLWKYPGFQLMDARPERASALARSFFAILAGAGVGETFYATNKLIGKIKYKSKTTIPIVKLATLIIFIILGVVLFVNSYFLMSQLPIAVTTNDVQGGNNIQSVFLWIKENVSSTSRVAFEEYPTPSQHSFAASPVETGIQEVGSGYAFWWSGADASQQLAVDFSSGFFQNSYSFYSLFSELNAAYVVAFSPGVVSALNSSGEFQIKSQIGQFYIFQLKNYNPSFVSVIGGLGSANVTSFQPEKVVVDLQNMTMGSELLVKESYYSNWAAYSSTGTKLTIRPYTVSSSSIQAQYMEVVLPNNSTSEITLEYQEPNSDITANSISYFSITGVIIAFAFFSLRSKLRKRASSLQSQRKTMSEAMQDRPRYEPKHEFHTDSL